MWKMKRPKTPGFETYNIYIELKKTNKVPHIVLNCHRVIRSKKYFKLIPLAISLVNFSNDPNPIASVIIRLCEVGRIL